MRGAPNTRDPNRYVVLIEQVFRNRYSPGATDLEFSRDEITEAATQLNIRVPKNLGDIVYSFRYRVALPEWVRSCAPEGQEWIIQPAGRGRYRFVAVANARISPTQTLAETKIPDATPGVIARYALGDEQALLARLRYNRLIDIFTGVTCYSLQSHLRTSVAGLGQVETDEVYVGLDRRGVHYVFPVQAKAGTDSISVVQIEQDLALCAARFPNLVCRPIAAQFMANSVIALFELEQSEKGVVVSAERHYRLTPATGVSDQDLERYRHRTDG